MRSDSLFAIVSGIIVGGLIGTGIYLSYIYEEPAPTNMICAYNGQLIMSFSGMKSIVLKNNMAKVEDRAGDIAVYSIPENSVCYFPKDMAHEFPPEAKP